MRKTRTATKAVLVGRVVGPRERLSRRHGRAGGHEKERQIERESAREFYSRNIYDRARRAHLRTCGDGVSGGERKRYKNVYTLYFRPFQRDTSEGRCVNRVYAS